MSGTLTLSWGCYGGFYASRYPATRLGSSYARICMGWVALTWMPLDLDDILRDHLDNAAGRAGQGETQP